MNRAVKLANTNAGGIGDHLIKTRWPPVAKPYHCFTAERAALYYLFPGESAIAADTVSIN